MPDAETQTDGPCAMEERIMARLAIIEEDTRKNTRVASLFGDKAQVVFTVVDRFFAIMNPMGYIAGKTGKAGTIENNL